MNATKPQSKKVLRLKAEIAALERQKIELAGQLPVYRRAALRDLDKAGDRLKASGCVLYLHALGGAELITPVVIVDGLSQETIAALKKDVQRSIDFSQKGF